ncbi:MAG: hypothetical protein JWL86_816 [Rhizobium sp.]|nr:hypothetical protein [Rhizobium sp.]
MRVQNGKGKHWGRKVTDAQREELLALYRQDPRAAAEMCASLGVSRTYAAARASERGEALKLAQNRKLSPEEKRRLRAIEGRPDHNDPRWAIAIQLGAVLA